MTCVVFLRFIRAFFRAVYSDGYAVYETERYSSSFKVAVLTFVICFCFFRWQADFQWASQLKQRLRGDSGHSSDPKLPMATIDILDASFEYGFEFLGNGPRLVITPLTDRIYVTATQVSLHQLSSVLSPVFIHCRKTIFSLPREHNVRMPDTDTELLF